MSSIPVARLLANLSWDGSRHIGSCHCEQTIEFAQPEKLNSITASSLSTVGIDLLTPNLGGALCKSMLMKRKQILSTT